MVFGGFAIQAVVLVGVFGVICGQSVCEVCSCQPSPGMPSVMVCKNYTLMTLPANISTMTHLMLINDGKIKQVLALDLEGLTQLEGLELRNNSISIIEAGAFQDLTNLLRLDLSNNNITQVTGTILSGLGNLTHLDVNNNKIGAVPDYMCTSLPSLESLNAQGNNIQSIGSNVFTGCKSLNHIDISNNELTTIAKYAFQNLDSLSTLDLSGNRLTAFYSAWLVNKSSNINLVMDDSTWHCTTQLKMEYEKMNASHPSSIGCDTQSGFCPLCVNFGGKRLENLTLEELNVPTTTASNIGTKTESSNSSAIAVENLTTVTSNNKTTSSGSDAPAGKAGYFIALLTAFFVGIIYQ